MTREETFAKRIRAYRESHMGVNYIVLIDAPWVTQYLRGDEPWLAEDGVIPGMYIPTAYGNAVLRAHLPKPVGRPPLPQEEAEQRAALRQSARADRAKAKLIEGAKVGAALYGNAWLDELRNDLAVIDAGADKATSTPCAKDIAT